MNVVQQPGTEAGPEQLEDAAVEQIGAEAGEGAKSQNEPAIEAAEATSTALSLTDSQEV